MEARLVALVPVLGLLLAGCSSGGDPEPLPVPSATVTASPTPTAGVPASAQPETREGAAAFVRYYYDALRRAFVEGDTSELSRVSSPGCQVCAATIATLKAEAEKGNRYAGGEITSFTAVAAPPDDGVIGVAVNYSTRPYQLLTAGSTAPSVVPGASSARAEVRVARTGGSWTVQEILRVER